MNEKLSDSAESNDENEMTIDTASAHVTPVGGNVFTDLGFGQDEATALKAEADVAILDSLARRRL